MAGSYGAVLVTHGDLGRSLLDTCAMITGPVNGLNHVSVNAGDDAEGIRNKIREAIEKAHRPGGTLLLVDMFGGTPSNIGISFLQEGVVEVVTGVNLPMLTKFANLSPDLGLRETAALLRDHGREHIKVASEYLSRG